MPKVEEKKIWAKLAGELNKLRRNIINKVTKTT
jgi:hypothetical protein